MLSAVIFALLGLVIAGTAVVLLSFLVEAMRREPMAPERLRWAPEILVHFVEVNGVRLRYSKTGRGPVLVLLHGSERSSISSKRSCSVSRRASPFTPSTTPATAIPIYRLQNTTQFFCGRSRRLSRDVEPAMSPFAGFRSEALSP